MSLSIVAPGDGEVVPRNFNANVSYCDFTVAANIDVTADGAQLAGPGDGQVGFACSGSPGPLAVTASTTLAGHNTATVNVTVEDDPVLVPEDPVVIPEELPVAGPAVETVGAAGIEVRVVVPIAPQPMAAPAPAPPGGQKIKNRRVRQSGSCNLTAANPPAYVVCVAYANRLTAGGLQRRVAASAAAIVDPVTGYWEVVLDRKLAFGIPRVVYTVRSVVFDVNGVQRAAATRVVTAP